MLNSFISIYIHWIQATRPTRTTQWNCARHGQNKGKFYTTSKSLKTMISCWCWWHLSLIRQRVGSLGCNGVSEQSIKPLHHAGGMLTVNKTWVNYSENLKIPMPKLFAYLGSRLLYNTTVHQWRKSDGKFWGEGRWHCLWSKIWKFNSHNRPR